MDGWMHRWWWHREIEGWMDGWVGGCIDGWIHRLHIKENLTKRREKLGNRETD